jgi:hypothetical protein
MAARMARKSACLIAGRNNAVLAHYEMEIFPTFREVFQNTIRKFSNAIRLPADSLIVSADRIRKKVRFLVKSDGFFAFGEGIIKKKAVGKAFQKCTLKFRGKTKDFFTSIAEKPNVKNRGGNVLLRCGNN